MHEQPPETTGAYEHDEKGVLGIFYDRAVHDKNASETEGYPVYKTVPYIKIVVPGDSRTIPQFRAKQEHKLRWPRAWAAFEQKQQGAANGTPIETWAYLNAAQAASLRHLNIFTIEQLASVGDSKLGNLGPDGRDLRARAQEHLMGDKEVEKKLRGENKELRAKVRKLEAQLESAQRAAQLAERASKLNGHEGVEAA